MKPYILIQREHLDEPPPFGILRRDIDDSLTFICGDAYWFDDAVSERYYSGYYFYKITEGDSVEELLALVIIDVL